MQHPKVVVIGAGSLFFGRQAIWQMVHSEHLRGGTLALVDTDEQRLDKMARLAEMAISHAGAPLALEAATDRRRGLPGRPQVRRPHVQRRYDRPRGHLPGDA